MGKFRPKQGGGSSNALCTASSAEILAGYQAITKDSPLPQIGTLSATGNASASYVVYGKTFYSTNFKNKLTGSMVDRGQSQYAGGFGSSGDYVAFNKIPQGWYHQNGGDDWAPEIRMSRSDFKTNVINYFGIASVTNFSIAQYSSKALLFTWANPGSGKMWSGIRIVGKQGGWPSGPEDGTVKYDSAAGYYVSGTLATGTWYFRAYNYVTTSSERWYGGYSQASVYNNSISGNKTFTSSTSWTVPTAVRSLTVFLVGGGGGAYDPATASNRAGAGAGGGYTKTTTISVTPGETLTINVPGGGTYQGGTAYIARGSSWLASAAGGYGGDGSDSVTGYNGGSGGGAPRGGTGTSYSYYSGKGGTDGGNGGEAYTYNDLAKVKMNVKSGGTGQGYSTKAWGNSGTPYSPGGGGASYNPDTSWDGSRGAGLTGNNSGAGANGVGNSKWDDKGTAHWNYGASGIVMVKW